MNQKRPILVVDDDPSIHLSLDHGLSEYFELANVLSADDMFEVLEFLTPELILLDVLMPGVDGFETAKKLKSDERYKDIPIIFVSGAFDDVSKEEGRAIGAVDYFNKPFDIDQLVEQINKHLEPEHM